MLLVPALLLFLWAALDFSAVDNAVRSKFHPDFRDDHYFRFGLSYLIWDLPLSEEMRRRYIRSGFLMSLVSACVTLHFLRNSVHAMMIAAGCMGVFMLSSTIVSAIKHRSELI